MSMMEKKDSDKRYKLSLFSGCFSFLKDCKTWLLEKKSKKKKTSKLDVVQKKPSTTTWHDLPKEMQLEVFKYLTSRDRRLAAHCSFEMAMLAFESERNWKRLKLAKWERKYTIDFYIGDDFYLRVSVEPREESCIVQWCWSTKTKWTIECEHVTVMFVNELFTQLASSFESLTLRDIDLDIDETSLECFKNLKLLFSDHHTSTRLVEKVVKNTKNLDWLWYEIDVENSPVNDGIFAMLKNLKIKRLKCTSMVNDEQFLEMVKNCQNVLCDGKMLTAKGIAAAISYIVLNYRICKFSLENLQTSSFQNVPLEFDPTKIYACEMTSTTADSKEETEKCYMGTIDRSVENTLRFDASYK